MRRQGAQRRGISLMMVMAFVAVSSIMGMAILSSNTLQSMGSSGQSQAAQADALAESGLNLGLYYLQNISNSTKCPAILTMGGGSYSVARVSLGAAISGNFDLVIARNGVNTYTVTSTGRAINSRGQAVQRVMQANVRICYFGYGVNLTAATALNVTIPRKMTVTGDMYSAGPVTNNGAVSGTLYANTSGGTGLTGSLLGLLQAPGVTPVPPAASVNQYLTYSYNNRVYSAGTLLNNTLAAGTILGPTDLNPAGVYVRAGALRVEGNVQVRGTLVVTDTLTVAGDANVITPADGFPGLIVLNQIQYDASGRGLAVNGLTYVGAAINAAGNSNSALTVNGALLCASASDTTFDANCTINVNYDRKLASIPTLVTGGVLPAPTTLSVLNWK